VHFKRRRTLLVARYCKYYENSVLQAEMQYAIKTGQQTRASVAAKTNIRDISRIKPINETVTASLATLSLATSFTV